MMSSSASGSQRIISKQQASQRAKRKMQLAHLVGVLGLLSLIVGQVSGASSQQTFEVQPEPQYLVQNGHDARLRCLVRNRQGECLWLRNGRAVGTIARKYQFNRQPDDGDCSLMIRNVSVAQDDGLWQCQVTASDVEQDTLQSREVHLVVLVAPERPQIKNMVSTTVAECVVCVLRAFAAYERRRRKADLLRLASDKWRRPTSRAAVIDRPLVGGAPFLPFLAASRSSGRKAAH